LQWRLYVEAGGAITPAVFGHPQFLALHPQFGMMQPKIDTMNNAYYFVVSIKMLENPKFDCTVHVTDIMCDEILKFESFLKLMG